MLLSVIIVNYNVKYFLEQCLCSVEKAIGHRAGQEENILRGQTEVWVVDNQSTDGSVEYLQARFPFVSFITNTENKGFARANNQALQHCTGKYVLYLNPDTIVPEAAFHQCLQFMEDHPRAGALGVYMIDGSGKYLPESKRAFPTPWVSFCKMTGLTAGFPTSKLFARYYAGHLSPASVHEIDVISGAFMWVRKEVLDQTGGFDERFFMYAEDIDLSYRIQQAGYTNYFLPAPVIIHFKGESTRRDARYTRLFYTAMILFVDKHFKGIGAWWYKQLLRGFIKLRNLAGPGAIAANDPEGVSQVSKLSYVGDENSANEIKAIAAGNLVQVAGDPVNGAAQVLCEGATFSYTSLIGKLSASNGSGKIFIHGFRTRSAVASTRKDRRGTTLS
ncbi:glycosyltransferase family 2 protein [Paraflavitalea sp. CAU 1676]|uniref:glycosyltransferase family 2 protein n=1 Tax=Paraflavitalea sp. CAU 1676 TaxID=3032598 RepID=UPI0023D98D6B|nr:glycosyltransferase family 2 protein [Paraflavitalea sp. CAU 1676]MDF2191011.1 glycosyltransferase family 2 protein [Paraflavitalea sp. CAU 1676]